MQVVLAKIPSPSECEANWQGQPSKSGNSVQKNVVNFGNSFQKILYYGLSPEGHRTFAYEYGNLY